jgi:DNA-binding NarL/FixJ family response regulator
LNLKMINWNMSNNKTRILIVEDHPIFLLGMSELINQEGDMMVCGSADDVSEGRKAVKHLQPDMVIVDLSLKSSSGIDLVKEISALYKKLPVLVLSMHDESLHAERCLLAGARGYIMKEEASKSVVEAIRQIRAGDVYVSQRIMGTILNKFQNRPASFHKSPIQGLSDREMEIFRLIGKGLSTGQIACQLNLSVKTVGTYRERIKEKLGLQHGGDLTKYAVLWVETDIFKTS